MDLVGSIKQAGGLGAIARELGLSERQAEQGATALLPGLLGGLQQRASGGGGLGGILSTIGALGGGSLLDGVLRPEPTDTSKGDQVLGELLGSKDQSRALADKAAQITGIDAATLRKMLPLLAMVVTGLLAKKGAQQGTGQGGLGDMLSGMLGGGSGSLGGLGTLLDRDRDGNPLDDVARAAGKLFGR